MRISDWSSDVCSSDLRRRQRQGRRHAPDRGARPVPDPRRHRHDGIARRPAARLRRTAPHEDQRRLQTLLRSNRVGRGYAPDAAHPPRTASSTPRAVGRGYAPDTRDLTAHGALAFRAPPHTDITPPAPSSAPQPPPPPPTPPN